MQQLISAGSLTRSLEVESCYDRQLVFPQVEDDASQTLDKMYYRLKEIAEEDCTPEARMKALQTVLLGRVLPQNNLHNNAAGSAQGRAGCAGRDAGQPEFLPQGL